MGIPPMPATIPGILCARITSVIIPGEGGDMCCIGIDPHFGSIPGCMHICCCAAAFSVPLSNPLADTKLSPRRWSRLFWIADAVAGGPPSAAAAA
jgi:hypothetical protein